MRRPLVRLLAHALAKALALVLTSLAVPVAAAHAQRGGGAPPYGGPRPEFSFDMSDGEPVSFYMEWSRVLELTPEQKTGLIDIRRRLRVRNAPFMRQLDSLREVAGIDLTARRRMTEEDREALRRFQLWAAPVIDSVRLNNDGARREIRALLDERQVARADSLNRASRDPRARRPDERGAAPGRRPPVYPDAPTFERW
jgi:Spy/CpxP family protein refolding chaperone